MSQVLIRSPTLTPTFMHAVLEYVASREAGTVHYTQSTDPTKGGYVDYKTDQGRISFLHTPDVAEDCVVVYFIEVHEHLRRQGICTRFIEEVIGFIAEDPAYRKFVIAGVENPALETILKGIRLWDRPFVCHGGDWIWTKSGDYCRCHDVDLTTARLLPHHTHTNNDRS